MLLIRLIKYGKDYSEIGSNMFDVIFMIIFINIISDMLRDLVAFV